MRLGDEILEIKHRRNAHAIPGLEAVIPLATQFSACGRYLTGAELQQGYAYKIFVNIDESHPDWPQFHVEFDTWLSQSQTSGIVNMGLLSKKEHRSLVQEDSTLEEKKLHKDEWDFTIVPLEEPVSDISKSEQTEENLILVDSLYLWNREGSIIKIPIGKSQL